MEPRVLTWLGPQFFGAEATAMRRHLVASQSDYQNTALNLALQSGALPEAIELAASAVLHFKGLATEEEAYLASIVRHDKDPRVRALATEVAALRARLARLFQAGAGPDVNTL